MIKIEISRSWIIPVVSAVITIYFTYHGIEGNRGIKRWRDVNRELEIGDTKLAALRTQKDWLTLKVQSLSQDSLDLDQLEESALRLLNMEDPEAQVIFDKPEK